MSENSNNIKKLLTRCNLPIPFGNKEEWEKFGQMYIPCFVLVDMYDDPAKYQKQILEALLTGKGSMTIWTTFISLIDDNNLINMHKIIKALVDGHMGTYGFEDVKFDNLEQLLNKFIENEGKKPTSLVSTNGLHYYKYRVIMLLVDETTQSYNITVELYQTQLENYIFSDLVSFGIYNDQGVTINQNPTILNEIDDYVPKTSINYDKSEFFKTLNVPLDKNSLNKEVKELKEELNDDDISYEIYSEYLSDNSCDEN